MNILAFGILSTVLIALGSPIVFAFLGASAAYFLFNGIDIAHAFRIVMGGANSFIFLSIPFFILTAELLNYGKISKNIFDFSNLFVGHIPGGLSHVNILTSIFFAGMSGSAIADMGGIGTLSYRAMVDEGFPRPYSAAVTVSSAIIGPIIPPSIPMVIYGSLVQASIGALFLGGVIPGLLMGLSLSLYCFFISIKRGYPKRTKATSIGEIWSSLKLTIWPLLTPVILLGGIYSGVFTPTEAAVVATLYSMVLLLFEKNVSLRGLAKIGNNVVRVTAQTVIIIATVALFNWIISIERIPDMVLAFMNNLSLNKVQFLLVTNVLFLILGCFLPTMVLLVAIVPILAPVAAAMGVSLVHFGVIITLNLMIGNTTPPFGMQLFLARSFLKVEINEMLKELWPLIGCLVAVLLLITYIEPLVMFLPNLMR